VKICWERCPRHTDGLASALNIAAIADFVPRTDCLANGILAGFTIILASPGFLQPTAIFGTLFAAHRMGHWSFPGATAERIGSLLAPAWCLNELVGVSMLGPQKGHARSRSGFTSLRFAL